MKEYYTLALSERKKIQHEIATLLESHKEIIFAYLYGSFLSAPSFHDIDIAVFVDPHSVTLRDSLDYELTLSAQVRLPYAVDVRLLNNAPLGFQNNVAHSGVLLFSRDDVQLSNMLEQSSNYMIRNAHLIRASLHELTA